MAAEEQATTSPFFGLVAIVVIDIFLYILLKRSYVKYRDYGEPQRVNATYIGQVSEADDEGSTTHYNVYVYHVDGREYLYKRMILWSKRITPPESRVLIYSKNNPEEAHPRGRGTHLSSMILAAVSMAFFASIWILCRAYA